MQAVADFNSIKVRLELLAVFRQLQYFLFQFHKGAIRTQQSKAIPIVLYHFNSIKVRLELRKLTPFECFRLNFNSIKVRLEPR